MHTEDVKFLMRKDKVPMHGGDELEFFQKSKIILTCRFSQEKLQKLNLYLSFKENKQKLVKQVSQDDDEILGTFGTPSCKLKK